MLREHAYEQLVRSKPEYADEFIGDDRFVSENGALVAGFSSSFEFGKNALGDFVQAKLKARPITLSNGTRAESGMSGRPETGLD